jgi:glyceraldehyde-3-phosphate dehydrogenase/erythrose-4-phosphate dehydrogenase
LHPRTADCPAATQNGRLSFFNISIGHHQHTKNIMTKIGITGWHDNEWGYSHRTVDLLKQIVG